MIITESNMEKENGDSKSAKRNKKCEISLQTVYNPAYMEIEVSNNKGLIHIYFLEFKFSFPFTEIPLFPKILSHKNKIKKHYEIKNFLCGWHLEKIAYFNFLFVNTYFKVKVFKSSK